MAQYGDRVARWASAAAPTLRKARAGTPHAADAALVAQGPKPSCLGGSLDFVSDLGVLAFASWTLIAYIGMATQARVSLLVPVWLATVPLIGALLFVLSHRNDGAAVPAVVVPPRRAFPASLSQRRLLIGGFALAIGSAILTGAAEHAPWALVWVGAFGAVGLAVLAGRLQENGVAAPRPTFGWPAHAFAALTGFFLAAMSLFINRPNGDDAFYVNRATGVSDLNRIPVRDIIFTDERVAAVSGTGLPVDSFSALQGALAHFVGVHAASVAYYVTPPLMTFFATWALWRLLRMWAPRNVVVCFVLGCAYWVFSAQSGLTPGSFFLNRMWQGKVIFVAWLVLTTYVLLTRWLSRRDASTAVLLLAAGLGSIGMTASAAFVTPLLFGTAVAPLLVRRDWRGLPVLLAGGAVPFLIGFIVTQRYPLVENLGGIDRGTFGAISTSWYFHQVFGVGFLAALGLIALWAAPWLTRAGSATSLTTGIAVVSVLLLAPGVLPVINDVTALTSVLRRTLWVIPLPALVGLLGAFPLVPLLARLRRAPALPRRLAITAPAVLVAGLLVAFGHPVWISWRYGEPMWESPPTWKMNKNTRGNAQAILRRYDGDEPILAEEPIMHAIALITVHPKPVNARSFYARLTPEPRQRTNDRLALTRFVMDEDPKPSRERIEHALTRLRVGLVCINESQPLILGELEDIGGYREAFRVRGRVCLRPVSPT